MGKIEFVPFLLLWQITASTIFSLLLISSIISFYSKEKSFKYYAFYSFFLLLYILLKAPYDFYYKELVYNTIFAGFKWYIQIIYHCAYFFFFLAFLDIKKHFKLFYQRIRLVIQLIFLLSTVVYLFSIIANYNFIFDTYFLYLYTPLIFLLAIFTIYKALFIASSLKYFFCIGSGTFILLAMISLIFTFNFKEENPLIPISYFYVGLIIEHLVFAFGLAYKVKLINEESLRQYSENEKIKQSQQKILQEELEKKEKEVLKLTKEAEHERTAKIKSKYEDEAYQLNLVSLQNQMNPHFIFNALNSIKVFLIENNKEQAIFYLNKFSKLIRKILESSRISEVGLYEELETIKLYLGIESMRFDNDFKFEVSVSENIDINTIKVPPLILQPFVENAIWHGLILSKREKKISISVYKRNHSTYLSLKDNGIGRKQSNELIQRKTIKKESLGLKMTKERINFYNQKKGTNYSYNINNLYDEYGEPSGTEVIFEFN